MKDEVKFPGLFEELPFNAFYILILLKRDKELFIEYSSVYGDLFITDMETQKDLVDELVPTRQLTSERKLLTRIVASDYTKTRNLANRAESYLDKVDTALTPLTMSVADFGIRQLRDELEAKNDEGIVRELRALHMNLENNKIALEPKGYTAAISTQFKNLIATLTTDSTAQNLKLDDRKVLTRENIQEMNKLWKMMSDVMEDGKKIGKELKNDAMVKDYTFSNIQKKVRLERKAAEEGGTPAGA